jgi:hypothetical protein
MSCSLEISKNVSEEFNASARVESSHVCPEDADGTFLLNIKHTHTHTPNYRASHPQRL